MNQIVQEFSDIIRARFEGRFRKDGVTPYFSHIENVRRNTVMLNGAWINMQLVALAHDAIEQEKDGWRAFTEGELEDALYKVYMNCKSKGYDTRAMVGSYVHEIMTMVRALTRNKNDSYEDYLKNLIRMDNILCAKNGLLYVKIGDMLDNLSDNCSEAQRKKYRKGLEILRGDEIK